MLIKNCKNKPGWFDIIIIFTFIQRLPDWEIAFDIADYLYKKYYYYLILKTKIVNIYINKKYQYCQKKI